MQKCLLFFTSNAELKHCSKKEHTSVLVTRLKYITLAQSERYVTLSVTYAICQCYLKAFFAEQFVKKNTSSAKSLMSSYLISEFLLSFQSSVLICKNTALHLNNQLK